MERIHRFVTRDRTFLTFLQSNGIPITDKDIIVFEISENDPKWKLVEANCSAFDLIHSQQIKFSREEIASAEWAELQPAKHIGYPQPESGGYKTVTYGDSGCKRCGIGREQIAPFRIKKAPSKRTSIFQLNWIFDEYFLSAENRVLVEESGITGIQFMQVLLPSGQAIEEWSQMRVPKVLQPGVSAVTLDAEHCTHCGLTKYHEPRGERLKISRSSLVGAPDIVKSWELFGSGARAYRQILISHRFINLILQRKWGGVEMRPVEIVDDA